MDPHSSYPPPTAKKTSPWVYVGCSCGALVILALGAIVATTWFGYRAAKDFAEGFENPEKRAERAREVLPYDTLPAGYETLGAFSIPFVVDLAFFSTERKDEPADGPAEATATEPAATEPAEPTGIDAARAELEAMVRKETALPSDSNSADSNSADSKSARSDSAEPAGTEAPATQAESTEPAAGDTAASPEPGRSAANDIDIDFGERGFIYLVMRRLGKERAELDSYLRGEGPAPDWMGKGNVNVASDEVIRNGRLTAGGAELAYSARRGMVTTNGDDRDGIFTMFLANCPDDKKARIGIWFAPDPEPDRAVDEVDWTGTPADPAALQSFAGHFRFCDGPS